MGPNYRLLLLLILPSVAVNTTDFCFSRILVTILLFEVVIFGLFTGAIGLGQVRRMFMWPSSIYLCIFLFFPFSDNFHFDG